MPLIYEIVRQDNLIYTFKCTEKRFYFLQKYRFIDINLFELVAICLI